MIMHDLVRVVTAILDGVQAEVRVARIGDRRQHDDRAVTLTDRGRDLLEAHRYQREGGGYEPRQTFYAGIRKSRELTHDTKVYRAYQRAADRLRNGGGKIRRAVLDYELD